MRSLTVDGLLRISLRPSLASSCSSEEDRTAKISEKPQHGEQLRSPPTAPSMALVLHDSDRREGVSVNRLRTEGQHSCGSTHSCGSI